MAGTKRNVNTSSSELPHLTVEGARPAGVNGGRTATPGPSDMAPRFRRAQYAVASSSQDQPKRHRVWLNCSPLAKPRAVVGVTR